MVEARLRQLGVKCGLFDCRSEVRMVELESHPRWRADGIH